MVGALRQDPHIKESQADLPPHVLSAVLGGDIHIPGMIKRLLGRIAVRVRFKEVEFKFRPDLYGQTHFGGALRGTAENEAGVPLKRRAVRVAYVAKHPHHLPVRGAPGQDVQRGGNGEQEEIGLFHVSEALYGGGVERNTALEGTPELGRLDGHIFLPPPDIAEGKADEADVLLTDELVDFLGCVEHGSAPPQKSEKGCYRRRGHACRK